MKKKGEEKEMKSKYFTPREIEILFLTHRTYFWILLA